MLTTPMGMPGVQAAARAGRLTRMGYIVIAVLCIVVLEGAVRKWLFPAATMPLILLRDGLAAYAIVYAAMRGALKREHALTTLLLLWTTCVVLWGLLQLVLGESNWGVFAIGLRFWLLYIWFGFAAAMAMSEHDYNTATRVALGLFLLAVPLVVLQYFSPPGSFINRQISGEEEDVFLLIAGIVRPTATFSFTIGYVTFLTFVAPLALNFVHLRKKNLFQVAMAVVVFSTFVVGSLVSGSRTAILSSAAVAALYFLAAVFFSRGAKRGRTLAFLLICAAFGGIFLLYFEGVVTATQERFQTASEAEDFVTRLLTVFIGESGVYKDFSWLGHGIGLGSNLASFFATGERSFVLAETEAGRTLLEGGLLGYGFIVLKIAVCLGALYRAWRLAYTRQAILPLLLWGTILVAALTWSASGQLTVNAMFGLLLAFGLLSLRYPEARPLR